jgi:hypothetical protein
MSFSFSGPDPDIIWSACGGMAIGAIYTAVAKTNQYPVVIFAAKELADWILYRLAFILSNQPVDRTCAKIYAATSLTVNVATLCLLRQMTLIGKVGTQIFLGAMALELACKCADFSKYRVDPIEI